MSMARKGITVITVRSTTTGWLNRYMATGADIITVAKPMSTTRMRITPITPTIWRSIPMIGERNVMIITTAAERGVSRILDGTNEDGMHVYRPGIRALKELGITSGRKWPGA